MATGPKPYVFRVSHEYVIDPESVERGHRVWAMYLAERLRKELRPLPPEAKTGSHA